MAKAESSAIRYVQTGKGTLKRVQGQMALYVKERKAIHVLNEWAFLVYHCLEEPASLPELRAVVLQSTDADPERLESDLRETLDSFLEADLVRVVQ